MISRNVELFALVSTRFLLELYPNQQQIASMVSPCFLENIWTHYGPTMDLPWTYYSQGTKCCLVL